MSTTTYKFSLLLVTFNYKSGIFFGILASIKQSNAKISLVMALFTTKWQICDYVSKKAQQIHESNKQTHTTHINWHLIDLFVNNLLVEIQSTFRVRPNTSNLIII